MDINSHNREYYLKHGTHRIPDLLSSVPQVQEAIRRDIESDFPSDPIRILELGFGSRPHRYAYFAKESKRQWDVYLSDFDVSVLPKKSELPDSPLMNFHLIALDLHKPKFPDVLFDVILSTYTFDSVNMPQDKFESGHHYPGGLVNFVNLAIPHLSPKGCFITIDKSLTTEVEENDSADEALFKTLDLSYAARILSSQGLHATSETLEDYLSHYSIELPLDLSDHSCLKVTRTG